MIAAAGVLSRIPLRPTAKLPDASCSTPREFAAVPTSEAPLVPGRFEVESQQAVEAGRGQKHEFILA